MTPRVSIIMPAYNAADTIETALQSIRRQTIADEVEILVIDGGSTDDTRAIARRYGATVLDNPQRLPEPAKVIGMRRAAGRYIVEQDTDEEWLRPDQLEQRLALFAQYPDVHCIVCDVQHPGPDAGLAAAYLCACGDPFSFFVNRLHKGVYRTFCGNPANRPPRPGPEGGAGRPPPRGPGPHRGRRHDDV